MMNLILLIAIVSSTLLCLKNKMTADTRKLVKIVTYICWIMYLLPIFLHISFKLIAICIFIVIVYLIVRLLKRK
jgi:hypothetical protein